MDGGGSCLELMWLQRGAGGLCLKKTTGVVYAGKKSGSEIGAPWVPLSAGPCPSSLWFSCAVDLQDHHLNPKLGSGKGAKRNLVSGK